jgi:FAD/FMN-containing dehydrogenase
MTTTLRTAPAVPGFRGERIGPAHPEYDAARRIWNGAADRRPALILRPRDAEDAARAIRAARRGGLPLAVRGGGHSMAGHSTCDDGLVIDLSSMRDVRVDPGARRAVAGGGALLGDLDRATQAHGAVVPAGHVSHTGVAGLTLGGGIGWLARALGLTIDSLVGAEVVTADGEVVRAAADEHPDLFWGLRGGGGNFGVVTRFEFAVHPLEGPLVAGMMLHPIERAGEVLRATRDLMASAPDEMTVYEVLITVPPEPPFPPALRGRPALAVGMAYHGPVEEGLEEAALFRAIAPPALDLVGPMPYLALQTMLDAGVPHGRHHRGRSEFLRELDDDAIDVLLEHFSRVTSPFAQVITARMGGAIARVPDDATAYGHRRAERLLWIANLWEGGDPAPHVAWVRELSDAVAPHRSGAVYVNALDDERPERVRAAYTPEAWRRLVALKDRWDPENVFRLNQNVPPSRSA